MEAQIQLERAFYWGIVIVGDAEDADIEELPAGWGVRSARRCVAIPVRHAHDVEPSAVTDGGSGPSFKVSVTVVRAAGNETLPAGDADTVIEVPSGRLSIGDADDMTTVEVRPGRLRIVVVVSPAEDAERMELTLRSQAAPS